MYHEIESKPLNEVDSGDPMFGYVAETQHEIDQEIRARRDAELKAR